MLPQLHILLCFIPFFFACQSHPITKVESIEKSEKTAVYKDSLPLPKPVNPADFGIEVRKPKADYQLLKNDVVKEKQALLQGFRAGEITMDSIRNYFTETLLNRIIPYWYGMPWDFSGYSAVPGQGSVGCSYFVSTTLEHIGLNVNRYKLAQQAPLGEAKTLALSDSVVECELAYFSNDTLANGIYFVGLSVSHVGYLLKRKGNWFFIQSNYAEPQKVIVESLEESLVFNSYNQFYVAPLSWNDALLKAWLTGTKVDVKR